MCVTISAIAPASPKIANPSPQPAATSENQWAPRYTRDRPTPAHTVIAASTSPARRAGPSRADSATAAATQAVE